MGCWGLFGLVWFLRRKNAECREGFVKIISSVGHRRMSGSKLCELLEPTRNVGIIYTAIIIASEMAMFCVPSEFIKKH